MTDEAPSRWDRIGRIVSRLLTVGVLVYLTYRLTEVGWQNVLEALPTTPLFYVLLLVIYFLLPLAEVLIYRPIWPLGFKEGMKIFIRKRIYNDDVMGYSGEVILWLWARRRFGVTKAEAFRVIRDVSIVSTVASTSSAVLLLAVLIATGHMKLLDLFGDVDTVSVVIGVVLGVALAAALWLLRRHLFSMTRAEAGRTLGIHLMRILITNTFILFQWAVAVPEIGWGVWFTYLAVKIVVDRAPFVPSKDLFFMSLGVSMSGLLGVAEAAIAGLFVATSALNRMINFGLLIAVQRSEDGLEELPDEASPEPEGDQAP